MKCGKEDIGRRKMEGGSAYVDGRGKHENTCGKNAGIRGREERVAAAVF